MQAAEAEGSGVSRPRRPRAELSAALLFLFGAGWAFFVATGVALFGLALPRRFGAPLAALGLGVAAVAAAPLPVWLAAAVAVITVGWIVVGRRRLGVAAGVLWLSALLAEVPYHVAPTVRPQLSQPTLYVIGDSLSAGVGGAAEDPWPKLLASDHPFDVVNLARAGATSAGAAKQAEALPPAGGIVVVEIGGNDLLSGAPSDEFERRLDALLGRVCLPGRSVFVLELPLPPLSEGYGRAQRRRARAHGAYLVPKRLLTGVLAADGATTDGVHLSAAGHARMAEAVWGAVRGAYGE